MAVVSSMIPIDADTGRSASSSARDTSRQGSGAVGGPSLRARAAHSARGTRASSRAERREFVSSNLVPTLGPVAEREERLAAARGGARRARSPAPRPRSGRRAAAPRRAGEGAVAADVAAEPVRGTKTFGEYVTSGPGRSCRASMRRLRAVRRGGSARDEHTRESRSQSPVSSTGALIRLQGDRPRRRDAIPVPHPRQRRGGGRHELDERRAIVDQHLAYGSMLRARRACARGGARGHGDRGRRAPGRATAVTDGPFAETKRGGRRLLRRRVCEQDEAIELAGLVPSSPGVAVEVLAIAEV